MHLVDTAPGIKVTNVSIIVLGLAGASVHFHHEIQIAYLPQPRTNQTWIGYMFEVRKAKGFGAQHFCCQVKDYVLCATNVLV